VAEVAEVHGRAGQRELGRELHLRGALKSGWAIRCPAVSFSR
jgi:hypothetical protein